MIELTLGAIAAALIAKALNRAEEKVVNEGEGVLGRLVAFVRGRLSESENGGSGAMERVEDAPDSPSQIEALAQVLDKRAKDEPEFRRELEALVEEAKGTGVDVGSITQTAYGEGNIQFGVISNSKIDISPGGRGGGSRPRRIAE